MTILKLGADAGLSARVMIRPNAGEGEMFAHLLLLPAMERGMSSNEGYLSALRADIGYTEPLAARAVAGERRSAVHLLALHCVHCLSRPLREARPLWPTPAFRGLQAHCLWALDRVAETEAFGGGDDES